MKYLNLILFVLGISISSFGQFGLSPSQRDSLNKLTNADYQNMLGQLAIDPSIVRRGPSGNPNDPNAANSSEEKVNEYILPETLILKNGKRVNNSNDWFEKRRPEIVADFESEIYGKLPMDIPNVTWQIISIKDTTIGNQPIKEKTLKGIVDNSSYPEINVEIELQVVTPASTTAKVPLVMEFGWVNSPWRQEPEKAIGLGSANEPTWKEQLISKGWGYAILVPSSVQADNGAGLKSGIIGLVNKGENRKPNDWGVLRAWAWGASKAIDYLETDTAIDSEKIAIEGLSRYGKAAILALAFEPRFSLGFIGSSGAGGAKILRRVFGEQVENLASSGEYHWFCGNFIKYTSIKTPDDLPVDAHQLVALCAPKPIFISSGSPFVEGQWVDAKGMFIAAANASPVYQLLGKKGLGTSDFPVLGMPLINGEIAFRQHAGGHSTGPNWSTWIAWASRYW